MEKLYNKIGRILTRAEDRYGEQVEFDDIQITFFEYLNSLPTVYTVEPFNLKYGREILSTHVYRGNAGMIDFDLTVGINNSGKPKTDIPLIKILEYKMVPLEIEQYYTPHYKSMSYINTSPLVKEEHPILAHIRESCTIPLMPLSDFKEGVLLNNIYNFQQFINHPIYVYALPFEYAGYAGSTYSLNSARKSIASLQQCIESRFCTLNHTALDWKDIPLLKYVLYPTDNIEYYDATLSRNTRRNRRYWRSDTGRKALAAQHERRRIKNQQEKNKNDTKK